MPLLDQVTDGDHFRCPVVCEGCLLKSQNDIISEIIFQIVIHIFNKDTKLSVFDLGSAALGIPKFCCRIQDLMTQGLTDICRSIQSL